MTVYGCVWSCGDSDVGIGSRESSFELDIEFEDSDDRESVRKTLTDAFDSIHDCGKTTVIFDDEMVLGGDDFEYGDDILHYDIDDITIKDVKEFCEEYYGKNNTFPK